MDVVFFFFRSSSLPFFFSRSFFWCFLFFTLFNSSFLAHDECPLRALMASQTKPMHFPFDLSFFFSFFLFCSLFHFCFYFILNVFISRYSFCSLCIFHPEYIDFRAPVLMYLQIELFLFHSVRISSLFSHFVTNFIASLQFIFYFIVFFFHFMVDCLEIIYFCIELIEIRYSRRRHSRIRIKRNEYIYIFFFGQNKKE